MYDETRPAAGPVPAEARWDDPAAQNTAGTHPGAVVGWFALMALLVAGLALMGAAFAQANGLLFGGGLLLAGLAFFIPLALGGRER